MKLVPEVKAAWLEKLRSGEVPQTRGVLKRTEQWAGEPPGMCCLGLVCEAYADAHPDEKVWGEVNEDSKAVPFLGIYAVTPGEVDDWAFGCNTEGMSDPYAVEMPFGKTTLGRLNDVSGLTFSEIADIIEDQL